MSEEQRCPVCGGTGCYLTTCSKCHCQTCSYRSNGSMCYDCEQRISGNPCDICRDEEAETCCMKCGKRLCWKHNYNGYCPDCK